MFSFFSFCVFNSPKKKTRKKTPSRDAGIAHACLYEIRLSFQQIFSGGSFRALFERGVVPRWNEYLIREMRKEACFSNRPVRSQGDVFTLCSESIDSEPK